jgi:hypothetical protein
MLGGCSQVICVWRTLQPVGTSGSHCIILASVSSQGNHDVMLKMQRDT